MNDSISDLRKQCEYIAKQIETGEYDFESGYDYEYPCAADYLRNALSIEYVVTATGHYNGAIILVSFGGSNIWIDTRWKEIRGFWWGERCTILYRHDELGIDDYLAEIRDC